MQRIYIAQSPPEAHVVRGYLEAAGVHAIVQGEAISALLGGVPLTPDTAPSVWVAESDAERAAALIADFFEQDEPVSGENWLCPNCQEWIEPQFTECWQCGYSRIIAEE